MDNTKNQFLVTYLWDDFLFQVLKIEKIKITISSSRLSLSPSPSSPFFLSLSYHLYPQSECIQKIIFTARILVFLFSSQSSSLDLVLLVFSWEKMMPYVIQCVLYFKLQGEKIYNILKYHFVI